MNSQKIYFLYLESIRTMKNASARMGLVHHEFFQDLANQHARVRGGEDGGRKLSGLRELGIEVWFNGKENTA
jgi:hypothetical protein